MNKLRFEMTCGACPEQYDVFKGDDKVGYMRLRWGHFTFANNTAYDIIFVCGSTEDSGWGGTFESEEQRQEVFKLCENVYRVYELLGDDFVTYDFDEIKSIEQYERIIEERYKENHEELSDEEKQKQEELTQKYISLLQNDSEYRKKIAESIVAPLRMPSLSRRMFQIEEISKDKI